MKGKKLLLGALSLAMLCTMGGGTFLMANAAEGPQVGSIVTWDGLGLNGTSEDPAENKTVITTKGGWARALLYVTDVTSSMKIEMNLTANEATALQLTLFDYDTVAKKYGADHPYDMAAETPLNVELPLTDLGADTTFCLAFYFDTATPDTSKEVTINSLTVGGVSYQPTEYKAPQPDTPAPAKSFKEYADWTVTGGTAEACTLENLPATDPNYEGAIDNGAAKVTFTSTTDAKIEIPLSEELSGWPSVWTKFYAKFKAENITQLNAYIESVENEKEDELEDAHAFCFGIMGAWNATVVNSVTDGYKFSSIDLGGYFTGFMETHDKVTKIVLVPVFKEGATSGSVEFGGMTFGGAEAPVFINDIGDPALSFTEWAASDGSGYQVEQQGELQVGEGETAVTYQGLKISYTKEQATTWGNVYAGVSNYNPEKHYLLHIGFYADTALALGIWDGANDMAGVGHKTYEAGYHEVDIDLTGKTYENGMLSIQFYLDSSTAADFEGTKTIVFDSIVFHKDIEIFPGDVTTNGLYNTPKYENDKLTWTYDAKDAGAYYHVDIPVENWYKFNRYLHLNVTFSHEMAFGVWGSGNALLDNVHQNSTHPVYGAGTYDLWLATQGSSFAENAINTIELYCDVNNGATASLTKTVTINLIEFTSEAPKTSSPNTNVLTVDYVARTITFAADYEVATAADFAEGTTLASGAAITPGATLYLRAKDGSSAVSSVTYAAVTLAKEDIAAPTVGSNYIRFGGTGYEYRLGDSTEWVDLGSWGNLEAGKEYTVHIRIKATATSFASEEIEYKVTTSKEGESQTPGGTTDTNKGCGGCGGSVIGYGSLGIVAGAAIALGCVLFIRRKHNN